MKYAEYFLANRGFSMKCGEYLRADPEYFMANPEYSMENPKDLRADPEFSMKYAESAMKYAGFSVANPESATKNGGRSGADGDRRRPRRGVGPGKIRGIQPHHGGTMPA
jgi:hypothetical protein